MFDSSFRRHHKRRALPPSLPVWKRAVMLLWLLFLLVAQNWHICELGGAGEHSSHLANLPQREIWKPKCGGGLQCPCEPPAGAIVSPTGKLLSDAPDAHSHTTCLARLLMGMAGDTPAPFSFAILAVRRRVFAAPVFTARSVKILSQPPSRGPPVIWL